MLQEIFISNFAIIENTNISFKNGLNIITGETGAGKSIIIEAIELLLGARANKDLVGKYSDKAIIEGVFSLDVDVLKGIDDEFGIEVEEDFLIVTREIHNNGRSVVRINGRQTSLSVIKDIMSRSVDLLSQNSSHYLLDKKNYISIIDSVSDQVIVDKLSSLNELIDSKNKIQSDINALDIDSSELKRNIDILEYQINEIESFRLDTINEDEITNEHKKLSNALDIIKSIDRVKSSFSTNDHTGNDISSIIAKSIGDLNAIIRYDNSIKHLISYLNDMESIVSDFRSELTYYSDTIDNDEEKLHELDSLITNLENLKRKYGDTIEEVIEFGVSAKNKLEFYLQKDELLFDLRNQMKAIEDKILRLANEITKIRTIGAKNLENSLSKELKKLNFSNNLIDIELTNKSRVDKLGQDEVDIFVSFNLGQDLKPLYEVASGGELSRFMLALKIVSSENDDMETMIFDEVDTGISGITAQVVGEVIDRLSNDYQIILVTHLPQIAVRGSHHILINKYEEGGISKTNLKTLSADQRIDEIARLIGGKNITKNVIESAKEQLKNASQ